jgi:hypothetical protein
MFSSAEIDNVLSTILKTPGAKKKKKVIYFHYFLIYFFI